MATVKDDIVQADITHEVEQPVVRLLQQMLDDAHTLQGLVVGYVRKDGNAAVRWTPMPAPMLSHLARIFDLKINRQYLEGMQSITAPTRPAVSSPISRAIKQAAAQARQSPAEKLQQRERSKNKAKQAGKTKA